MRYLQRPGPARVITSALLVGLAVLAAPSGRAQESVSDLRARLRSIQAELDATTAEIQELDGRVEALRTKMSRSEDRIRTIERRNAKLQKVAIARANELYRSGGTGLLEALLEAQTFGELSDRAEALSQVSIDDARVFVRLTRGKAELEHLMSDLAEDRRRLLAVEADMDREAENLQAQFDSVAAEYETLLDRLAAAQPEAAPAVRTAVTQVRSGGMVCPVQGPHSFINDWGYPRSGGRTHQGNDIMAPMGTPVVAIVSGTVTYAGYGSSAGNWQILSGDDGNSYWYMHNQSNLVGGGHVATGQQIATVGNTGNASGGSPHLHFEYHPGGGSATNPYPLLVTIC